MTFTVIKCECKDGTGLNGCQARASWLVGWPVGGRQYSCGRHLNRTCWAMVEAEMPRRNVTLTVTPVLPLEELVGQLFNL
jgi:hypothetical protein